MRMTALGRGLIFQPVLLACTYNNDTIITLQKKIDITDFHHSLHTQKVDREGADLFTDLGHITKDEEKE